VYRPCIASFEADLQELETSTMGSKLKDHFEPYWDDEKDCLSIVEFLPRDDPEARSFFREIQGKSNKSPSVHQVFSRRHVKRFHARLRPN
jgi:hypothetical protein